MEEGGRWKDRTLRALRGELSKHESMNLVKTETGAEPVTHCGKKQQIKRK